MNRRLFMQLFSTMLTAGSLPAARADSKAFTIGIFPRYNISTTHSYFAPLVKHLGQGIGRKTQLITTKDFNSFWRALKEQQFDLVHFKSIEDIDAPLLSESRAPINDGYLKVVKSVLH